MLKKCLGFLFAFFIAVSVGGVFARSHLPTPNVTHVQSLDRILAVVNGEVITQNQFNHALHAARQQFAQNNIPMPNAKKFKQEVLQQLINQKLQLQLAKRNNVTVSDEQINAAIGHIAAQNHATVSQLKAKIAEQHIPYKVFRNQIRKQLTITKLQQEALSSSVTINKTEIAAYRKRHQAQISPQQYQIATVLIPLPGSATKAQIIHAKEKALLVMKQLHAGFSFNKAMQAHPGSLNLGWRPLSQVPQIFVAQVLKLKTGEIAGPIKAPNGFHIIKLQGIRETGSGISDNQIQQIIFRQKFEKALQKWLQTLRKSAYIHIYVKL